MVIMSNLTVDSTPKLLSTNNTESIKLLVFNIGKLTLSLPILQVQKVVKHNQVHGSGLSYVNLAHIDEREIAVVDLHQKLFKISLTETSQTPGYFIITKNVAQEPLGIWVSEPPALIDVATSQIRLIPDSYRRADTLEIASHVAVITQEDRTSQTIFILDLEKLI